MLPKTLDPGKKLNLKQQHTAAIWRQSCELSLKKLNSFFSLTEFCSLCATQHQKGYFPMHAKIVMGTPSSCLFFCSETDAKC